MPKIPIIGQIPPCVTIVPSSKTKIDYFEVTDKDNHGKRCRVLFTACLATRTMY